MHFFVQSTVIVCLALCVSDCRPSRWMYIKPIAPDRHLRDAHEDRTCVESSSYTGAVQHHTARYACHSKVEELCICFRNAIRDFETARLL